MVSVLVDTVRFPESVITEVVRIVAEQNLPRLTPQNLAMDNPALLALICMYGGVTTGGYAKFGWPGCWRSAVQNLGNIVLPTQWPLATRGGGRRA